jgi:hypothetical protein
MSEIWSMADPAAQLIIGLGNLAMAVARASSG